MRRFLCAYLAINSLAERFLPPTITFNTLRAAPSMGQPGFTLHSASLLSAIDFLRHLSCVSCPNCSAMHICIALKLHSRCTWRSHAPRMQARSLPCIVHFLPTLKSNYLIFRVCYKSNTLEPFVPGLVSYYSIIALVSPLQCEFSFYPMINRRTLGVTYFEYARTRFANYVRNGRSDSTENVLDLLL